MEKVVAHSAPLPLEPETRKRIIVSTIDLLRTKSYGSVSVEDICRAASVNKSSLYHFYPSKSDVLIHCLHHEWNFRRQGFETIFTEPHSGETMLHEFVKFIHANQKRRMSETNRVCGCLITSMGCETSGFDERVRKVACEIFLAHRNYYGIAVKHHLQEKFSAEKHLLNESAIHEISILIQNMVLGALTQAKIINHLSPLEGLAEALVNIVQSEIVRMTSAKAKNL